MVGGEGKAEDVEGKELRSYRGPWKGELVLACGKCQRKLRGSKEHRAVAKLKKSLKQISRARKVGPAVTVIQTACLKLCPKGGVTVCLPLQVATSECSIVRTRGDLKRLYEELMPKAGPEGQVADAGTWNSVVATG